MNGVYRAGIHTGAAVDAGVWVNFAFVSHFADGIHWARLFTCSAVDAFVGDGMGQGIHLLFFDLIISCLIFCTLAYGVKNV